MTQDETTSNPPEVFMGPTGSETEEFYTYQRKNPGLEKTEYLAWFEKKFKKEIELRRRRSDQPSDLEYMVIKKRSKYRERIGEESTELVQYSDQNPHKTYRELAEWFQGRFGKEIDITAISRELPGLHSADVTGRKKGPRTNKGSGAIKRVRSDDHNPPHPDVAPAAKRGRRSNANTVIPAHATKLAGGPIGSNPTFAVDMSARPPLGSNGPSPNQTPSGTPNHTPKNGHAILPPNPHAEQMERKHSISSTSASSHHPHHQGPPHGYHHHQRHPADSPSAPPPAPNPGPGPEQPRTPMWATVNHPPQGAPPPPPNASSLTYIQTKREPHPPSGSPRAPPPSVLPSSQPPNRSLRSKNPNSPPALAPAPAPPVGQQQPHTHQRHTIAAYPPPPPSASAGGPPPPPPAHQVSAMPPGPPREHPFSPRREATVHMQQRYSEAVALAMKANEDMRSVQSDLFALVNDRASSERRLQDDLQALSQEHDELRQQLLRANSWIEELQRGNIELQSKDKEVRQWRDAYEHEREGHIVAADRLGLAEDRLREQDYQLENARKVLRENHINEYGSPTPDGEKDGGRRSRRELDEWVNQRFQTEAVQTSRLSQLVDEVENAGWKDVTTKLEVMRKFIKETDAERQEKMVEWPRLVGRIFTPSPLPQSASPTPPQPQTEDTRMQDAGDDADDESREMNGDRKGSKASSSESDLTPTSRNPSGSPIPTPPKSQAPPAAAASQQAQTSPAPPAPIRQQSLQRETRGAAASKADRMEE